jgi:hypothetical protein
MIESEKAEDYKWRMEAACFTAWQLGAGSGKSLNEYLRQFGLSDEPIKLTKEQIKIMAQRAIEKAERVRIQDQMRNKK